MLFDVSQGSRVPHSLYSPCWLDHPPNDTSLAVAREIEAENHRHDFLQPYQCQLAATWDRARIRLRKRGKVKGIHPLIHCII